MSLQQGFKDALASWASGVTVVSTRMADGAQYGLTVSSFCSVSLDPPLILVCLNQGNRLPAMIAESGAFSVCILAQGQADASNAHAQPGREPEAGFSGGLTGTYADNGQPVLDGSAAWVSCSVHARAEHGSHTILIGEVVETHADSEAEPLLYFRRGYRSLRLD